MNVPPALIVEIMHQKRYQTALDHYNNIEIKDLVSVQSKMPQGEVEKKPGE